MKLNVSGNRFDVTITYNFDSYEGAWWCVETTCNNESICRYDASLKEALKILAEEVDYFLRNGKRV